MSAYYTMDDFNNALMKKTPCLNCKDRKLKCHATCKAYLEFKNERNKYLESVRLQSKLDCIGRKK